MIRTICKSRVYQLHCHAWNEDDQVNFSHTHPKRLPAEVLHDTIYFVTGSDPAFPGVPRGTRAAQLPDVGVKLDDGFWPIWAGRCRKVPAVRTLQRVTAGLHPLTGWWAYG